MLPTGFLQVQRAGLLFAAIVVQASHCSGFSCYPALSIERRLRSHGAQVQLLHGTWDLPGPGIEPLGPALAVGFLTTRPAEKPHPLSYWGDRSKSFQALTCQRGSGDPGSPTPACCVLRPVFPALHSGPQHEDSAPTLPRPVKSAGDPGKGAPTVEAPVRGVRAPGPPSSGPQTAGLLRGQTAQHAGKQPGGNRGLEPSAL